MSQKLIVVSMDALAYEDLDYLSLLGLSFPNTDGRILTELLR